MRAGHRCQGTNGPAGSAGMTPRGAGTLAAGAPPEFDQGATETPRPANGVSPSSALSHADQSMLNAAAEQKRQSVGINPPHQGPDAERRPLGGNYLQLHRGPRLQPGLGSDFRATCADIHGARQVSARPDVDDDGPGHAGPRVAPSVLLPSKRHDGHSLQLMSTRNRLAHCLPYHGVQPRASNEQHGDAPSEEPE